ncbi:uncharacterized protein LOC123037286 [Drosophila rhopaloa]|uniref:DUF5641 domain-containing protein n=1 Tax=Drosophila rhopaloa TaxID=1041015 RepID=A0ABM5J390_DRORH|nr:uncharacterized protein LOC123037286 [Drosophila rhopaloa]
MQSTTSNITWRHVPGKDNPADIVSRGCAASELMETIWFRGPSFLRQDSSGWPQPVPNSQDTNEELELRKATVLTCTDNGSKEDVFDEVINKFSSYRRILRVIAFVLRVFNRIKVNKKLEDFKQQLFDEANTLNLQKFSSIVGFEFKFIPPRAPHFGGLWEAAVKSMKSLMMKNLGNTGLTYEELQTIAIESEAILNSRPMAPLSEDPNDGEALSPAHLLIGSSLMSVPEPSIDESRPSYLTRWQRVTYLKQQFWELWRRDYLHTLQERSKWLKPHANIQIGQMVIVHEDNTPPQEWILGRITNTHVGADGRVRVAEIKVKNGTIRRPICKIAPLPEQTGA